ncbi:LamG domain-containing protein [Akkermansiaceae bacterium]|nr:LamG domain-containing protein [Akkermansiaceae bacterium]MDB4547508.1 LamG domain-containing protein [Akkermansiaceae bacterium]
MKKQLLIPAFLMAASLSANAAGIHTGLLNYWALETDASDTAGSYAGSTGVTTDNGTVNGTTTFAQGLFGNAASFPGGTGNNITVLDGGASAAGGVANDVDRTASDMTVSVWMEVGAWSTGWQGVVSHGEQTDYRIARNRSRNTIAGVAGTGDLQPATVVSATSGWHHVALTSVNGGDVFMYIDGVQVGSSIGAAINQSEANNNVLCIGCNPDNGREFNGLIDDVAIWDRALTPSEIELIHNEGLAGNSLGAIAVPEPSSITLALIAGLGLLRRRR